MQQRLPAWRDGDVSAQAKFLCHLWLQLAQDLTEQYKYDWT